MDLVLAYLAFGTLYLIIIKLARHLSRNSIMGQISATNTLPEKSETARGQSVWMYGKSIAQSVLQTLPQLVLWPIFMFVNVVLLFRDEHRHENESGIDPMSLGMQHRQELLTQQEIEARETVWDPLCAVPNVPFGHLNDAWQRFIEQRSGNDELWSFTYRELGYLGGRQVFGYMLVENLKLVAYFISERRQT